MTELSWQNNTQHLNNAALERLVIPAKSLAAGCLHFTRYNWRTRCGVCGLGFGCLSVTGPVCASWCWAMGFPNDAVVPALNMAFADHAVAGCAWTTE